MNKFRAYFVFLILIMFVLACSTFSGSDPNNAVSIENGNGESVPTQTATLVASPDPTQASDAPQTGELPPLNLEEVLTTGIDAGDWTYEEGLVLILKYLLNQADEADIPGISQVVYQSGTGIAQLAKEYVEQPDGDPDTQAELARLLDILFIPQEILDMVSRPVSEVGASPSAPHLAALTNPDLSAQNQDACIALETGEYDLLTEDTVCFLFEEREITLSNKVWVYYPIWPDELENALPLAESILDTLEDISVLYDSYDGLDVKSFHFVLWPPELPRYGDYTTNLPSGEEENCRVHAGGFSNSVESDAQKQKAAIEMFKCVIGWTFVEENENTSSYWWESAAALYFSNVAFPFGQLEWSALSYFDERSVDTSILDMGEENFIFFQWLGNVYGTQKVAEILGLVDRSDASWVENIASHTPGNFNRFVVMYLSEGIADQNTGIYFASPSFPARVTDTITVDEAGDYTFDAEFLVASRYEVVFEEQKRFVDLFYSQDNHQVSAVIADQQGNLSAWSDVPLEIRSECDDDVRYLFVANHIYGNRSIRDYRSGPVYVDVAEVERAVCDPCLLGTWQVDNVSFSNFMNTLFAEYVPQAGNFNTVIQGNYYLQFDTEGKIQTQREGLTAYIYLESQFSMMPTLDPYNPGPQITNTPASLPIYTGVEINSSGIGNYSADGDYMRVTQLVDVVKDVNTGAIIAQSSPGGFLWIPTDGQFEYTSAFNSNREPGSTEDVVYVCEGDVLDITMNETGTDLLLTRVEKILPTPVPTQYIPTVAPE